MGRNMCLWQFDNLTIYYISEKVVWKQILYNIILYYIIFEVISIKNGYLKTAKCQNVKMSKCQMWSKEYLQND